MFMKKTKLIFFFAIFFYMVSCDLTPSPVNYRQLMRDFVKKISLEAREENPSFIIIPQNAAELITQTGEAAGSIQSDYVSAINGLGQESLFYGFPDDNKASPAEMKDYLLPFFVLAENNSLQVLIINYCRDPSLIDDAYSLSSVNGFISFSADHRSLDNIPEYPSKPFDRNDRSIDSLIDAKNFLSLFDPGSYWSKYQYLNQLQ